TRESISSGSSQEPGISLFYSVPTLPAEAEIRESISLQTSQIHYTQYDDDDEYQGSEPDPALLTTVPLSTHQNTQTAAEIYRDVSSTIETRISNNTMSEGLLPSSSIPPPLLSGLSHRKFKDPVFAFLFMIGLIAMTIIGISLLFTTNSSFKDQNIIHKSVFFVIRDSAWPLFFSITFSLCSSFAWLYFLCSFVQPLVWGTLISVPFVFSAMFIWAFASSLTGPLRESGKPDPQDNWLLSLSFIPFFISLGSVVFLYTRRKNVNKTINIIELACEILNANRRMVNVSLTILGAYILFTIIWLIFFSRVFLFGHMVQTSSSTWMFYQNSHLIIFFVFMYLWTSAVLYNIQRVTLAGVVSDWYFYRRELDRDASQDTSSLAFRRATTSSFGSVCLGGLILSTAQLLHLINEFTKKT
ncbi:6940_t:CDS:10, partial [Dentiscutata erythropus]